MKRLVFIVLMLLPFGTMAQKSFDYSRIGEHPRLLLREGEEQKVLEMLGKDSLMQKIHCGILDVCDGYLDKAPVERIKTGRRLLSVSREALQRIYWLSYAYRMTGEQKYAERARQELLAVSAFSDWNPSHFLDVGEMTMAVAIGYDWLYRYLSESDRKTLSEAIYHKGFRAADNYRHARFYRMTSNWNQVCNSGLVYGAIATYENDPEEAERIIEKAVETNRAALESYAPDGGYPEGYSYWGYGSSFQIMMVAAMESAFGSDAGLGKATGFLESAWFMQFMTAPSGQNYNFSDSGPRAAINPMMFWCSGKLDDPSLLWLEIQRIKELPEDFSSSIGKYFIEARLMPSMLIFSSQYDLGEPEKPQQHFWFNRGINPIFAYKGGWSSSEDTYLGIKGGAANASHAHMDAGSFIYEKDGVRWSMELGMQNYHSLESRGVDLWNRAQDSQRWDVFRIGNTGHSTVTMNGMRHNVEGRAEFIGQYREPDRKGATLDMTPVFGNLTEKALRTIFLDGDDNLCVTDTISNGQAQNELQWIMVTPAEAHIAGPGRILLSSEGKQMVLEVESEKDVEMRIWSNDPPHDYDAENPGTLRVGFTAELAPGEKASFRTTLKSFDSSYTSSWRSVLYPEDWKPGYTDSRGRFLHDFSYAGYHSGLVPVPEITENIIDVTKAPYRIDNTGKKDMTAKLQKAIDRLAAKGGGVIYLPEGKYRMSVPEDRDYGVKISSDSIIIRGAGAGKTMILNTSTFMRGKTLFDFRAEGASWDRPAGKEVRLTSDIMAPATAIPVENASEFKEGDLVIIRSDITPEFREEHKVGAEWDELTKGVHFIRTVTGTDLENGMVYIDVPTRYFLKIRDNARIYRINRQLSECGMENLSFGNIQHPNPKGWGEEDYRTEGNGSYYVHGSHMVAFRNAENCWARGLSTFHPDGNAPEVHILSNCLLIYDSRFITVEKCDFQRSQFEGGGGNGYMYTLWGNDCMIRDCHAEHGRHNYDFKGMSACGNVILRCTSKDAYKATDFHMHLSMANLIDSFIADGDCIDAGFRPYGTKKKRHMYSTTESVIWNTTGLKRHDKGYLVRSLQFGNGYVVGTSGQFSKVVAEPATGTMNRIMYDTAPVDWTEGIGAGKYLTPQSLYEDQFSRRLKRISAAE